MTNFSSMTDSDLFGFFSDLYKDVNGVRPHSPWDRQSVINFCEHWTSPEAVSELLDQWDEESEYLKRMKKDFAPEYEDIPDRYEIMAETVGY